jgi:hypothetical protein
LQYTSFFLFLEEEKRQAMRANKFTGKSQPISATAKSRFRNNQTLQLRHSLTLSADNLSKTKIFKLTAIQTHNGCERVTVCF